MSDDKKPIEYLTSAVDTRETIHPLIKNEPRFYHLHDDPRFIAILDRVGVRHCRETLVRLRGWV